MVPNGESASIGFKMGAKPICNQKKFPTAIRITGAPPKVVVAQSVLGDCNRVVLQADLAVIVQLRNADGIVGSLIVGLLGEGHVIFPEFGDRCVGVFSRRLMPKGQVALPAQQVGAENAAIVVET